MNRFEGKVVVITGTSVGIGRASAIKYAAEGAKVIGIARRENLLLELKADIEAAGGVFVPYVGDVTNKADLEGLIDKAVELYGKIDILINCAGTTDKLYMCHNTDNEMWDNILAINLTAPYIATKRALKYMLKQENGGSIVNVGSVSSVRACVGGVSYTSSKHAIMGLTRSVAYGYAKMGIRCNLVMPGGVDTYLCSPERLKTHDPEGSVPNSVVCGPMIRLAQPEEIADVIMYASSDDASILNGAIIAADAGYLAS